MKRFFLCHTLHGAMYDYKQFPAWVWPGTELHSEVEDYVEANLEVLAKDHIFYPPKYETVGSDSYRVYSTAFVRPPEGFAEGQGVLVILESNDQTTWVREIL